MFFGLTISFVMFQTVINEILQDLINIREVISLIDNIIVETEKEERYNDAIEVLETI